VPRRVSATDEPAAPTGLWKRQVHRCAASVARFHGIVAASPAGPARDWLAGIGRQLDVDLEAVRRLAALAQSIEPRARIRARQPAAKRVAARLATAVDGFRAVENRAADIAVQLALDPSYDSVRAQLDVLEQQVPHLARAQPAEDPPPQRRAPRRRRRGSDR
jgi:hypothetical protein